MEEIRPLQRVLGTIDMPAFESVKQQFSELAIPRMVRKGRVLVDIGEINDAIYFIHSGVIRSYYLIGSEDITSRLISDGEIACVAESFFPQRRSEEVLETLEDTMISAVPYDMYRQLADVALPVSKLIIELLEQRLITFSERVRLFKYLTVEQRIEYYISQPNSLFRRVPDHYIATYLGTTPATFSKSLKMINSDKLRPS